MKMPGKIWFVVLLLVIWAAIRLTVFVPKTYAASSPSLGTAKAYSVIAGSAVTNTGITSLSGDMGISPGTTPPNFTDSGTLTLGGALHDADSEAASAQSDRDIAAGALDAQGCDTTYDETKELAGETLVPGVYCATSFHLSSGTLTLNGDSSGVWIFKSTSDLIITGSSAKVVFTGDGLPCNVWWRVVSTATLGGDSSFVGNILADTSVTFAAGASLNGRALASTAEVTLSSNSITGPTCVAPTSIPESDSEESSSDVLGEDTTCKADDITTVPIIIETKRVNPTSIFVSWGPYEDIDTFVVEYGPQNGQWLYNTPVTGFTTTINDLPANQPIWFRVAGTNECAIGTFGSPVKSGGTPLLPDTGLGPPKSTSGWYIIIPIILFVGSILFVYSQIKRLVSLKR